MINLKKLAMISAMGMVLSTSAMAEAVPSNQAINMEVLTPITAGTVANSSNLGGNKFKGALLPEDTINLTFPFTGEISRAFGASTSIPSSVTFTNQTGSGAETFAINFKDPGHPSSFDGNGDASIVLRSDNYTLDAGQVSGHYTAAVNVSISY
jgi:hypothetical protein